MEFFFLDPESYQRDNRSYFDNKGETYGHEPAARLQRISRWAVTDSKSGDTLLSMIVAHSRLACLYSLSTWTFILGSLCEVRATAMLRRYELCPTE